MKKIYTVRMMLVSFVFTVILVGMLPAAFAQAPTDDVFGVIRITNPEGSLAEVAKLIDKVTPGMGQMATGMATMQLQQVLQNPEWKGLDKAGEYTVVVLDPMKNPSPVAIIVPVIGKDDFVNVLKQSKTGGEEVNGIYKFGQDTQLLFAAFTGKSGILADNEQIVTQVKALVDSKNAFITQAPLVKGQMTASVAVSKIIAATKPMLEGFTQMMMMGMQQGAAQEQQGAAQPPVAELQNVMQAEMNALIGLLEQTDTLQLGIAVNADDSVRITQIVAATANSAMATFFAAQAPKKTTLAGFIPADSAVIATAAMKFTPEFIAGYADFSKAISTAMNAQDAATADKMAQLTKDSMALMGEEFAVGAFSASQEAFLSEVLTLKDAQKAKQLYEQMPEIVSSMLGMYKNMGVNLNMTLAGKEAYKGGEILNFDLGMKAADIPDPEGQSVFKAFFGDELSFPLGFVKNYAAVGFGRNAKGQVQKMMEALEVGKGEAPKFTPAQFKLPEENNFFMYLSVPKMYTWIAKYAPDAPKVEVQEGPGIAMSAKFAKAHIESEIVIPVGEIQVINAMVQAISAAQPPAAAPAPATK